MTDREAYLKVMHNMIAYQKKYLSDMMFNLIVSFSLDGVLECEEWVRDYCNALIEDNAIEPFNIEEYISLIRDNAAKYKENRRLFDFTMFKKYIKVKK